MTITGKPHLWARALVVLSAGLALLLCAGCQEEGGRGASGTAPATTSSQQDDPPSTSPPASPSSPGAGACLIDTKTAARPASQAPELSKQRTIEAPSGNQDFYVTYGVLTDGTLLASANTPGSGGEALGTPHLGVLTDAGFSPLSYDDGESSGRQITAATAHGKRVVWVETTSTDLFSFDWIIYSAQLDAPGRKRIGDSASLLGGRQLAPVFGQTRPTIAAGQVYWAATERGGKPRDSVIWSVGQGEPRVAVDRGLLPTSAGDTLFYVRPSAGGSEIVHHKPKGRSPRTVVVLDDVKGEVTALAASAEVVAWVVSQSPDSATLNIKRLKSGEQCQVALHQRGAETMVLSVAGSFVAWGSGSVEGDAGEYLFNTESRQVWRLGDSPGYSVAYLSPGVVAWAELSGKESASQRPGFHVAQW